MAKWKFWETAKKINTLSTHSFNNGYNPWGRTEDYNLSNPHIDPRRMAYGYVPFGEDNNYPQLLLDLYLSAPFHSSVINFKSKAILGDGIEINLHKIGGKKITLEDEISLGKLKDKMNREFLKSFILNYLIHNRICVRVERTGEKSTSFSIVPSSYVRSNEKGTKFYINPDWQFYGRHEIEEVPIYDKHNDKEKVQLLVFQNLTPGIPIYGLPEYGSASSWISLDAQIAIFQKSNIENSINPSAIIAFPQEIANPEEKKAFINSLKDSFSGAQNAGKIMAFFANGKELLPEVTIAEPNKLDKSFAAVAEAISKNVSFSHNISPIVLGISSAGKLGATSEINDAFAIFKRVYLNDAIDTLEEYLNVIARVMNPEAIVTMKRNNDFLEDNSTETK